jgi:histidyl-tRNA synthetase
MKYANKMGNKYVIIIGDDEINNNTVVLKNMISGEQSIIEKEKLVNIDSMIS